MPRTSSVNIHIVAAYCFEPRTITDICMKFLLSTPQAHRTMKKLVWSDLVSERMMRGNGAQRKIFLRSDLDCEHSWERKDSLKDAIPAHDPFGLTTALAFKLSEQGVSVEKFSKTHTRKIRVLDIEPKKQGGLKFREVAEWTS